MAVLFRGECRRCLSSVKFQKGEAVVTEQTFFWRRSRLFDNKQPKPDLAVPLSSVVACRESFFRQGTTAAFVFAQWGAAAFLQ